MIQAKLNTTPVFQPQVYDQRAFQEYNHPQTITAGNRITTAHYLVIRDIDKEEFL